MKIKSIPYDYNGDLKITLEDLAWWADNSAWVSEEEQKIKLHLWGVEIIEDVII